MNEIPHWLCVGCGAIQPKPADDPYPQKCWRCNGSEFVRDVLMTGGMGEKMIGLEVTAKEEPDELVDYASFYLGQITEQVDGDLYVLNVRLFRPDGESWRAYDGLNPLLVRVAVPYFQVVDTWPPREVVEVLN